MSAWDAEWYDGADLVIDSLCPDCELRIVQIANLSYGAWNDRLPPQHYTAVQFVVSPAVEPVAHSWAWTLSDDLGTPYRQAGGSDGRGRSDRLLCKRQWQPLPPSEANCLYVTISNSDGPEFTLRAQLPLPDLSLEAFFNSTAKWRGPNPLREGDPPGPPDDSFDAVWDIDHFGPIEIDSVLPNRILHVEGFFLSRDTEPFCIDYQVRPGGQIPSRSGSTTRGFKARQWSVESVDDLGGHYTEGDGGFEEPIGSGRFSGVRELHPSPNPEAIRLDLTVTGPEGRFTVRVPAPFRFSGVRQSLVRRASHGSRRSLEQIISLLLHEDYYTAEEASECSWRIGEWAEFAYLDVLRDRQASVQARVLAAEALRGSEKGVGAQIQILCDNREDPSLRETLALYTGQSGDERALAPLTEIALDESADREMRRMAIHGLGSHLDLRAIPVLVKLAGLDDDELSQGALFAAANGRRHTLLDRAR
jgi:hypothetical protein